MSEDPHYETVKNWGIDDQYERIVAFCSVFGPLDLPIETRAQVEKYIMQEVAITISTLF